MRIIQTKNFVYLRCPARRVVERRLWVRRVVERRLGARRPVRRRPPKPKKPRPKSPFFSAGGTGAGTGVSDATAVRSAPHLGHSVRHLGDGEFAGCAFGVDNGPLMEGTLFIVLDIFYFFQAKSFAAAGAVVDARPPASHSALISWGCSY